ncbi:hypothetical protein AB1Y20_019329 [Prymnesium parvum]|uniref:Methyltransferase domain-containing protein n=1 Tax=Prymnesium parvum TaxID=97485 RepID=A0AB34JS60_PRYPA
MVAWKKKSHARAEAIEAVCARTAELGQALPRLAEGPTPALPAFPWEPELDPAAGELDEARALRKRQQIVSAAAHALTLTAKGAHVVEFGAGQGHLGLLLARLRPDAAVTLVEVKEYSCAAACTRAQRLALRNVRVFHGSLEAFEQSGEPFDVALGLHLCGLLTDATLELAARRGAAACIVPCCYGQLFGAVDHHRGGSAAPRKAPFSSSFRAALGEELLPLYAEVAKGADHASVGHNGAFDTESSAAATAQRCMKTIDTDRLLWLLERFRKEEELAGQGTSKELAGEEAGGLNGPSLTVDKRTCFSCELRNLEPVCCSPKNSVILVSQPRRIVSIKEGECASTPLFQATIGAGLSKAAELRNVTS